MEECVMDAKQLGRRLRAARAARGLSQQKVAQELGLSRTAITQLEAGHRSVSTLELTAMSELYLRHVSCFLQDPAEDNDEDVLVALHRSAPGLEQDSVVREQVAHCIQLCREGTMLERLLGAEPRSGPPKYEWRMPHSPGDAIWHGERAAEQERRRLGIGNAPIADIADLISSQGIWATGLALPDGMSGLFLRHTGIGLAILVNSSHARGRQRFSYAHEYAHALLDRDRDVSITSTDNSSQIVEKRANAFATAFLMPSGGVREFLRTLHKGLPSRLDHAIFDAASGGHIEAAQRPPAGSQRITYKDNAMLARQFGVSYQAASYRLKSLRYISYRECRNLLDHEVYGRKYLKALSMFSEVCKPEQQRYWDRELRSEIAHLAIEAYRREEISSGRIHELGKMLRIDHGILLSLAEVAQGS